MTIDEQDRQAYVEKLNRVIDGVDQIRKLPQNSVLTREMLNELDGLQKRAAEYLPKIRDGLFEIAIVGLESSGKSTVANALLGVDAAPMAQERCTYTSTSIRAAEQTQTHVVFFTVEEFTKRFQKKLKKMGIPEADRFTPDNLSIGIYQDLFDRLPAKERDKYLASDYLDVKQILENWATLRGYVGAKDLFISEDEMKNQVHFEYIREPATALAVKNVTIHSRELRDMPTAVMYDVPGFNSPTANHPEATKSHMRTADAIVVVAEANHPNLTVEVVNIFNDVFKQFDDDEVQLKEKLFVFANKADDVENLGTARELTEQDWVKNHKYLPAGYENKRIVFGSGAARLGNKEAQKKLDALGIDDGIDTLRERLIDYYGTERFTVLRRRVDRLLDNVRQVFGDVDLDISSAPTAEGQLMRHVTHQTIKYRERLVDVLDRLKSSINEHIHQDEPLVHAMRSLIEDTVTTEKYGITQDEVHAAHVHRAGVDGAAQPDKVDGFFREQRFQSMYNDFTAGVLEDTVREHMADRSAIVRAFLGVLGIQEGSSLYGAMKDKVEEFCGLDKVPDSSYYQSLIERFARDMFEILIKFTRASRANKFRESAANVLSLSIFYEAETSESGLNIDVAPRDAAMWRLLLYPSDTANTDPSLVLERLIELTSLPKVGESIKGLVSELVSKHGSSALRLLRDAFSKGASGEDNDSRDESGVRRILEAVVDKPVDETLSLHEVLSGSNVGNVLPDYRTVVQQFSDDILALGDVLSRAVVPAVNLDTAFSARESKLLEDIVARVQSAEFVDFIADNVRDIESAKVTEFERNQVQAEQDMKARREISAIVKAITTYQS